MKRNTVGVEEVRNVDIILVREFGRGDPLKHIHVYMKITLRRVLPRLKIDVNNGTV